MFQPSSPRCGRVLRVNNVARRLCVSQRTVRWYAETGQIPAFRLTPKLWGFYESDVEAFRHRRVSATTAA